MPHIRVTSLPSSMFSGTGRTVSKGFPTGTKDKRKMNSKMSAKQNLVLGHWFFLSSEIQSLQLVLFPSETMGNNFKQQEMRSYLT